MKPLLLVFALSVIVSNLHAQVTFQKHLTDDNFLFSVNQTASGGYIISGVSTSIGIGVQDVFLALLDASGDTIWTRSFRGLVDESAYAAKQTSDGGFIVTGFTDSGANNGSSGNNILLMKVDPNGTMEWIRVIGGPDHDDGGDVMETDDGGFMVTGSFNYLPGSNSYLMKTDNTGNPIWFRLYEGTWLGSVKQTTDNGFIMAGTDSADMQLVRTDSLGNLIWMKTYGGNLLDNGRNVFQTLDGGFILAGWSGNMTTLVKTDASGDTLWTKTMEGNYSLKCLHMEMSLDGYALSGETGTYPFDMFLMKTDLFGTVLWAKAYGTTNVDERSYHVKHTSDGGYVIAGGSNVVGGVISSAYLIKTDQNGISGCNETNMFPVPSNYPITVNTLPVQPQMQPLNVDTAYFITDSGLNVTTLCTSVGIAETIHSENPIRIYPNPVSTRVSVTSDSNVNYDIYLINGAGKTVMVRSFINSTKLDVESIAPGIYLLRAIDEEGRISSVKFIKE